MLQDPAKTIFYRQDAKFAKKDKNIKNFKFNQHYFLSSFLASWR
jgi:hypothetical protein